MPFAKNPRPDTVFHLVRVCQNNERPLIARQERAPDLDRIRIDLPQAGSNKAPATATVTRPHTKQARVHDGSRPDAPEAPHLLPFPPPRRTSA